MMSQYEIGYLIGECEIKICVGNELCTREQEEEKIRKGEELMREGIKKLQTCNELSDSDRIYAMQAILKQNEISCHLRITRHLREKGFSDMTIQEIIGISQEEL